LCRCGGVLEAVRVARLGFPVRSLHAAFLATYRMLVPRSVWTTVKTQAASDSRAACTTLLASLGMAEGTVQIGTTKVFFRKAAFDDLEGRRQKALRLSAVVMQAAVRRWLAVKRYSRIRALVLRIQSLVRGHRARLVAHGIRRNNAATRLQAFARRCVARAKYVRYLHAVVRMQSWRRGAVARRVFLAMRRQRAAVMWQAAWARHLDRRRYLGMRAAAVRLQCWERQRRAKALLDRYRREAREVGNLKASNIELRAVNKELAEEVAALRSQLEAVTAAAGAASSAAGEVTVAAAAAAAQDAEIATLRDALQAARAAQDADRDANARTVAALQAEIAEWRQVVVALSGGAISALPIDPAAVAALLATTRLTSRSRAGTGGSRGSVDRGAASNAAAPPPIPAVPPPAVPVLSPVGEAASEQAAAAPSDGATSARSDTTSDSGSAAGGAYADFTTPAAAGDGGADAPGGDVVSQPAATVPPAPARSRVASVDDGAASLLLATQATEVALLKARLAEADRQLDAIAKE
jgi:hypothetical protein